MSNHTTHDDTPAVGFWLYLMSDCLLFASLFATYAVLFRNTFGGPTIGDIFVLPFVFTETIILLTSSFTVGLSLLMARQGKKRATAALVVITLLLGLAFLGMELSEFGKLIAEGNGPSRSAFLSAFFTLLGTHGLHVFLGAFWMLLTLIHVMRRGLTSANIQRLTLVSLFWHFLDVIWIFIFTIVYLFGAL